MRRRTGGGVAPAGLARTNVLVSAGTGFSRLTGFARVWFLAHVLGQGDLSDAFIVGNNLPNQVYELLLGGVLSAQLVPQFVQYFEEDDDDSASAVVSAAVAMLLGLTVVATAGASLIAQIYAKDRIDDEVARFGYFLLPQILFYGLTAVMTSLLNAKRRFVAAAFAPVLNNVVAICVLVAAGQLFDLDEYFRDGHPTTTAVMFLGIGTTLGVVAMAVGLAPAMGSLGLRLRWRPDFGHPAVRVLVRLSGWTMGYVVANQIASATVQRLAQDDAGGATAYSYAYVFFVLPHGLLAMSLVTTFAPDLASSALNLRWRRFAARLSLGLRAMVFFVAPAAALMAVLARPLVGLMEGGKFTADDAQATAEALTAFAIGLVGFSTYLFVLRGFYARKDTRTPFVLNVVENVLNVVFAFYAIDRWGVTGLAGAFAAAYLIAAVIALVVLHRTVTPLPLARLATWAAKVGAAAVWCAVVGRLVGDAVGADSGLDALVRLAVGGLAGLVTFAALMAVFTAVDRPRPVRPAVAAAHR